MTDPSAERLWAERLKFSFQFASLAVLYYDFLLTLPDEINYIWRSKWRLSSLFYIFCRYALVANLVYYLAIAKNPEILDCNTGYTIAGVLSILGHAGIIAVWGLRTYAICDKNKYVAALLGLPGSAVIILLIIRAPFNRCTGPVVFPGIRGAISALMIFFDLSAFLLATLRAWRTVRADRKAGLSVKASADYVIFSQGLTYIAAVSLMSVASISMNWTVNVLFARFMNGFKLPLAGLLTARFLLELRKWEECTKQGKGSLSLPRYAFDRSFEDDVSASVPKFSLQDSTGSIFTELGGDVGPPREEEVDDDDPELDVRSVRSSSSIRKGKRPEDLSMAEVGGGPHVVLVQSPGSQGKPKVDKEGSSVSLAGPSRSRGRSEAR